MPYSVTVKGIRIRTLNAIMLILSLIIFAGVLYSTFLLHREYTSFIHQTEDYITWERAAHQIHAGSDHLTEQSRLYAQTGKKKYADNFFYELYSTRSREKASEFLAHHDLHPEKNENLQRALLLSNALTTQEIYAIRLVAEANHENLQDFPPAIRSVRLSAQDRLLSPEEKIKRAQNMLYSTEYQQSKNGILSILNKLIDQNLLLARAQQKKQSHALGEVINEQRLMLGALCIMTILTFTMIILLIVKPLQSYLKCIRDDKMLDVSGAYEFKHLAATYNKIFSIKERHDKILQHKAEHDPLTGLLNRSAFDSLRHLLACDSSPVTLLLIDVDKFKAINDTFGHEVGDKTLQRVAELLRHSFRSDDMCIRIGGDEFAVVMQDDTNMLEQRIKSKIEFINHKLKNPDNSLPVLSISVGIAISHAGFPESLYNNADMALYHVKRAGRCGCLFYHELNFKDQSLNQ